MAPKDHHQLREAYTHSLLLAGRHWRRAADAVVKEDGLSDATAHPQVWIGRLGQPRQNALAEAMGVEGPMPVRLLDQLCSSALVARREDPIDRRTKVLSLTAPGQTVVAKIEAKLLRETVFASVSAASTCRARARKSCSKWRSAARSARPGDAI